MPDLALITVVCFVMTVIGIIIFRRVREYNPTMAVLIVAVILALEIFLCMLASNEMI